MTNEHTPSPSLDTRGASHYTGLAVNTLKQWRCKGGDDTIPFLKIGRSVRYLKSDLDAYLESRRCRSTVEARAKGLSND